MAWPEEPSLWYHEESSFCACAGDAFLTQAHTAVTKPRCVAVVSKV
jgi:hypothetical protein